MLIRGANINMHNFCYQNALQNKINAIVQCDHSALNKLISATKNNKSNYTKYGSSSSNTWHST